MRNVTKIALLADEPFTAAMTDLLEAMRREVASLSELHACCERIRKTTPDEETARVALSASLSISEAAEEAVERMSRVIAVTDAAELALRLKRGDTTQESHL